MEALIGKLVALAQQAGLDAQALARIVAEVPAKGALGATASSQPIPPAQGTPLEVAFQAGARAAGAPGRTPAGSQRSGAGTERSRSPAREVALVDAGSVAR